MLEMARRKRKAGQARHVTNITGKSRKTDTLEDAWIFKKTGISGMGIKIAQNPPSTMKDL